MTRTFADIQAKRFWEEVRCRRLPAEIRKRAMMRLLQLRCSDACRGLARAAVQPAGTDARCPRRSVAVRINDQWRICFRFRSGDAFDVEIVDHH